MSVIMDVADAVTTLLNEHDFAIDFTAVRRYRPVFSLEDLQTLQVSVVPKSQEVETATRSDNDFDYAVDIGVQKCADPDVVAELDALTDLVEELIEHLLATALPAVLGMSLLAVENDPIYDPDDLDQKRVFTSILTLEYTSGR